LFMHNDKIKLGIDVHFAPNTAGWLPSIMRKESSRFDASSHYRGVNTHIEFGYNKKTMQVFLNKCTFEILPQDYRLEISKLPSIGYQVQIFGWGADLGEQKPIRFTTIEKFYAARSLGQISFDSKPTTT